MGPLIAAGIRMLAPAAAEAGGGLAARGALSMGAKEGGIAHSLSGQFGGHLTSSAVHTAADKIEQRENS
jgi:hypothetical protein